MRAAFLAALTALLPALPLRSQAPPRPPTPPRPPSAVLGRSVTLFSHDTARAVRGELLAASGDSAWVLTRAARIESVRSVALPNLRLALVRQHSLTPGRAFRWGVIVGVLSGVGLYAACSGYGETSGCGGAILGGALSGAVVGGLGALTVFPQADRRISPITAQGLAPYARFPQGLPPGFLPASAERDTVAAPARP